jgi:hypothetical protein
VGVQKVRWDRDDTEPAGEYIFFYGKGNENQESSRFFVLKRIISAIKRVEFISDRMSYIILRGRWCEIVALNIHAPAEDKIDVKDSFYEELEGVFNKFSKHHSKIVLGDFNAKVGRENILKPKIGNASLQEINNDNGVRVLKFATFKNLILKVQCCYIITSINFLGHLQMEKRTIKLTMCLPSRCLAMGVSSDSTIPAFRCHVTI